MKSKLKFFFKSLSFNTADNKTQGVKFPPHYKDWASLDYHDPAWDVRTRLIATLVPERTCVLEFGAGRRQLEKYIPASCAYIPSDLESRGEGTFICDLNIRPLPDLPVPTVDVVVFGGVLEYVTDIPSIVSWLSSHTNTIIASYVPLIHTAETKNYAAEQQNRKKATWVNSYHANEFVDIFEKIGFLCTVSHFINKSERKSNGQKVYVFKKPI